MKWNKVESQNEKKIDKNRIFPNQFTFQRRITNSRKFSPINRILQQFRIVYIVKG